MGKIGQFVRDSVKITARYVLAKLLACIVIIVIGTIALRLIGIPGAFICSLAAGLLNLVPVIGEWGSVILVSLYAVIIDPMKGLYTLIVLLVLQAIDGFVITPAILGQALDLKPTIIILVTIAAGIIFGGWAVLIAAPAAAIIKLAYDIFWRGRNNDDRNPLPPA